jgi:hypothetical protein
VCFVHLGKKKPRVHRAGAQPEPVRTTLDDDRGRHRLVRVTLTGFQQPAQRGNSVLHLALGGAGRAFVPHGVDERVEGDGSVGVDQ